MGYVYRIFIFCGFLCWTNACQKKEEEPVTVLSEACQSSGIVSITKGILLFNNDWGDKDRNQCIQLLNRSTNEWQAFWDKGEGAYVNYPSLIIGQHGWGLSSDDERFPLPLEKIASLKSTWETATPFGPGDKASVSYDIWLSDDSDNKDRHDLEVKVTLREWGGIYEGFQLLGERIMVAGYVFTVYGKDAPPTLALVMANPVDSVVALDLNAILNYIQGATKLEDHIGTDVNSAWLLHGVESGFEYVTTTVYDQQYKAHTKRFELELVLVNP